MNVKPQETAEEKAAREAREAETKRLNDAVVMIQSFERARIGRLAATRGIVVYFFFPAFLFSDPAVDCR